MSKQQQRLMPMFGCYQCRFFDEELLKGFNGHAKCVYKSKRGRWVVLGLVGGSHFDKGCKLEKVI